MTTVLWTVKDWFLWTRCLEGREYTPTLTSGRWQKSGSVSNEIELSLIQQVGVTTQGRTQDQGSHKKVG
jgi:hypothetical protein